MNIEKITKENKNYRKVLETNKNSQLVVMSLKPQEEIGFETHSHTSQYIKIEKGHVIVIMGKNNKHLYAYDLTDGYSIMIPPGFLHNVIAVIESKLYTIYSPPEHPQNLIQKFKP